MVSIEYLKRIEISNFIYCDAGRYFEKNETVKAALYCFVSLQLLGSHVKAKALREKIKSRANYNKICLDPFFELNILDIDSSYINFDERIHSNAPSDFANYLYLFGDNYLVKKEDNVAVIFYYISSQIFRGHIPSILSVAKLLYQKGHYQTSLRYYVIANKIKCGNHIAPLPLLIAYISNITSLNLSNCYLQKSVLVQICATLKARPNAIVKLDISNNNIGEYQADILTLDIFICLIDLNVSNCQLNGDIAIHISRLTNLQILNLNDNKIDTVGFKSITANLPVTLKKLSMRNNFIDYKESPDALKELESISKKLPGHIEVDIAGNLIESMKHNKYLKYFLIIILTKFNASVEELLDSKYDNFGGNGDEEHSLSLILGNGRKYAATLCNSEASKIAAILVDSRLLSCDKLFTYVMKVRAIKDSGDVATFKQKVFEIKENDKLIKDVCKNLLDYHPDRPLKSYLRTQGLFRSPQLHETKCLLQPLLSVSKDNWMVYLIAKIPKASDILSQHAWLAYEGLTNHGQRFFQVADLTAPLNGIWDYVRTLVKEVGIHPEVHFSASNKSTKEIVEYLRSHTIIASFKVNRKKVRKLHEQVVKDCIKLDKQYKIFILSFDSKKGENKNTEVVNCIKWAVDRIDAILEIKIPDSCKGLYIPHTVVSEIKKYGEPVEFKSNFDLSLSKQRLS